MNACDARPNFELPIGSIQISSARLHGEGIDGPCLCLDTRAWSRVRFLSAGCQMGLPPRSPGFLSAYSHTVMAQRNRRSTRTPHGDIEDDHVPVSYDDADRLPPGISTSLAKQISDARHFSFGNGLSANALFESSFRRGSLSSEHRSDYGRRSGILGPGVLRVGN